MSVFGGSKSSNVFGRGSDSNSSSVFGGGTTRPNAAPQQFHSQSRELKPATESLFGKANNSSAKSLFGKPETSAPSGINDAPKSFFGKSTQNSSSNYSHSQGSLFSTTAREPLLHESNATNVFRQDVSSKNVFGSGQPQSNSTQSLFGNKTSTKPATSENHSFFKSSSSSTSKALFGKPIAKENIDHFYSGITDLTDLERLAFSAEDFVMGCIPLKLPPLEMCQN